jgi:hypothetical protein
VVLVGIQATGICLDGKCWRVDPSPETLRGISRGGVAEDVHIREDKRRRVPPPLAIPTLRVVE